MAPRKRGTRRSEKRRPKAKRAQKKATPTKRTSPLNWLKADYGAAFLAGTGPVILASWHVPEALQASLRADNQPVPARVFGVMLLDTGATLTSMSVKAAHALGLQPTRISSGYGAGGKHQADIYYAQLQFGMSDGNRQTVITSEREVQAIPDLDKPFAIRIGGQPRDCIGLIGRDILRHAKVEYDGIKGTLKIRFNLDELAGG